jgi:hypothetical protein
VINYLNSERPKGVAPGSLLDPLYGYLDVNGDSLVAPIDALLIINALNADQGEGDPASSLSQAPLSGLGSPSPSSP